MANFNFYLRLENKLKKNYDISAIHVMESEDMYCV